MDTSSIIAAVATAPGRSARGIVRLSGPGTMDLLRHIARSDTGDGLRIVRGIHRARLGLSSADLPVLLLLFPGPHSYTGEDAAELQVPGNPVLLERVIDMVIDRSAALGLPARRAEAGEFTARAYFNGRLGLTEAEGVAATIAAHSDAELRAAGMLRTGRLGKLADDLADRLAEALALLEAGIDFTDEEDVVAISPDDLAARLDSIRSAIHEQLDRAVAMEQLEAIPWVVLTGAPNAGKSTLFNALLGRTRAVVSPVAGTTRDVLAEPMCIDTPRGSAEVMLVDVAGTDPHPEALNELMQSAGREARERAEVIIHCVPVDETEDADGPDVARGANVTIARTKSDLGGENDRQRVTEATRPGDARPLALRISAHTEAGLNELRTVIAERLASRAVSLAGDVFALQPRHESALRAAKDHLDEARQRLDASLGQRAIADPEIVAATMRAALDDLGALAGHISPDDVLGRVFASFCIGK